MKKGIKKTLENITEDAVIGLLVAGCSIIAPIVKNKDNLKFINIERKVEVHELWGTISPGDLFLYEHEESRPLTEAEIDSYLDDLYNEIRLPKYLDKDYIKALTYAESRWNPVNVSKMGAIGIGQLMPNTLIDYKKYISHEEDIFDPNKNLEITLRHVWEQNNYLRKNFPNWKELSDQEKRDINCLVYNYGITRLEENNWNLDEIPEETKDHIENVRNYYLTKKFS